MALHLGIRQSRTASYLVPGILEPSSSSFINKKPIINQPWNHKHKHSGSNKGSNQGNRWANTFKLGAVAGLTGIAFKCSFPKNDILAEDDTEEARIIDQESRIRQYTKIGTIFDYFATFKYVKREATDHSDEKSQILMSVKDFYNAVVPGSSVTHGYGRGNYEILPLKELNSQKTYQSEKLPIDRMEGSVLNDIQKHGMLTYVDFCFLLNVLAIPRRYLDIVFHCFDVSADGKIEAKEFAYVMAEVIYWNGDPDALIKDQHSGLMDYLFGVDRTKSIDLETLVDFQERLIDDVLWLEFTRYDPKGIAISDEDFCKHLLLSANFTNKKKKQMMARVNRHWHAKTQEGVGFEEFKDFYKVLFGGKDLERAMFYLNKKAGVDSNEFLSVAHWVTGQDVIPHIVELIYMLLDDNEDELLSVKEFSPVLFQWRHARGFHHQALKINLGRLRI